MTAVISSIFTALLLAQTPGAPSVYPPPAQVRADFLKLLDRPKVAPDPQAEGEPKTVDGLVYERLAIATDKHADGSPERVPMLVVQPAGKTTRRPTVIVLHGTGGNREAEKSWLEELARRGMVGVAIDGRFHGRRGDDSKIPLNAYNTAILKAWHARPADPTSHPFYYDTCWDVWRTIDYLQTRDDVDPAKIGLMGISKGGIETWLAAAVDDRVKVIVPAISVQCFRWSLDQDQWQGRANTIIVPHRVVASERNEPQVTRETCRALWNKLIPGILDEYDGPSMLRLCAGRPMLIVNGELDSNCPLQGAKIAFASAQKAYQEAHAAEKLQIDVAEGVPHRITPEQHARILDWFQKWLVP